MCTIRVIKTTDSDVSAPFFDLSVYPFLFGIYDTQFGNWHLDSESLIDSVVSYCGGVLNGVNIVGLAGIRPAPVLGLLEDEEDIHLYH
jgi:hypothetical protein